MITIIVGTQLRTVTRGSPVLDMEMEAGTVDEAVTRADERYPGFRDEVVGSSGGLRSNIRIARRGPGAGGELSLDSALVDGDRIEVMRVDLAGG
jgi:hypothetical protein